MSNTTGAAAVVPPRFRLKAAPFCPVAQTAKVALAVRGTPWIHDPTREDAPARLLVHGGTGSNEASATVLADPWEMLDRIEAEHPQSPLLPADPAARAIAINRTQTGLALRRCLSAVTRATEPNECDVAVHSLRRRLEQAEVTLVREEGHELGLVDVAFAPVLWRLRVLDERRDAHLLDGLPGLRRWGAILSSHPAVRVALGPDPEDTYLAVLDTRGIVASMADAVAWQLLLGHGRPLSGAG